jgi:hypothetical protein
MVDTVRRDDDDDEDAGVDTDGTDDRSTDKAVDVAVDEVVIFAVTGAIGPGDEERPKSRRGSGRSRTSCPSHRRGLRRPNATCWCAE